LKEVKVVKKVKVVEHRDVELQEIDAAAERLLGATIWADICIS
jgi:hypothetical protein